MMVVVVVVAALVLVAVMAMAVAAVVFSRIRSCTNNDGSSDVVTNRRIISPVRIHGVAKL